MIMCKNSKNNAQVFIISLWVLAILSVLALSLARQVSLGVKISGYHRDKVKAIFLAKAAVNRAIVEILNDKTSGYDTPEDIWADNKDVFKEIRTNNNQREFSTVFFTENKDIGEEIHYGVVDEERKININTASRETLIALFEKCNVEFAQEIVNNILIWRGTVPDSEKIYEKLGYPCKGNKFSNIQELVLVKDMDLGAYNKLKNFITVYGSGNLNVNTASDDTLNMFAGGLAAKLGVSRQAADNVVIKIIALRVNNGYFRKKEDINIEPFGAEEINLFNELKGSLICESNYFLIEASGYANKFNKHLNVIFDRQNKRILCSYEI